MIASVVAFLTGQLQKNDSNHKREVRPMRKFLILGVAALALSACSDKGADADGDGKISDVEAKDEMGSGGAMVTKPGLWEIKMVISKVEGEKVPAPALAQMKEQAAKGMTMKSCMTKEQVDKPGVDFFGGVPEANCAMESLDRSGNKLTGVMKCKPAPNVVLTSKMDGTFAAESYTMNVEQSTEMPSVGIVKMTGKIDATRVGDCPA
jgi:Protein of unknown function (DUF3617)